jgi:hypothetical protein
MFKKLILVILCFLSLGVSGYDSDKVVIQCEKKVYELRSGFNELEMYSAYQCRFPDLHKTCLIIKGVGMYCWGDN